MGEAEKKCLTARVRSLLSQTRQANSRPIEASGQPRDFSNNDMYSVRQKMKDKNAAYMMEIYIREAGEYDSARWIDG